MNAGTLKTIYQVAREYKIFRFLFLSLIYPVLYATFGVARLLNFDPHTIELLSGIYILVAIPGFILFIVLVGMVLITPLAWGVLYLYNWFRGNESWTPGFYYGYCAGLCISIPLLTVISFRGVAEFRMYRMPVIAHQGNIIVEALNHYKEDHGKYPDSLNQLTPAYLDQIPETRVGAYHEWNYRRGSDYPPDRYKGDGGFTLWVTTFELFAWDRLFYWPSENYPENVYGGPVVRIENWAYVRE